MFSAAWATVVSGWCEVDELGVSTETALRRGWLTAIDHLDELRAEWDASHICDTLWRRRKLGVGAFHESILHVERDMPTPSWLVRRGYDTPSPPYPAGGYESPRGFTNTDSPIAPMRSLLSDTALASSPLPDAPLFSPAPVTPASPAATVDESAAPPPTP